MKLTTVTVPHKTGDIVFKVYSINIFGCKVNVFCTMNGVRVPIYVYNAYMEAANKAGANCVFTMEM